MGKKRKQRRWFLAEWRKNRGLSQEALAARIGLTQGMISQLETGRSDFTRSHLDLLADELGCDPTDFYRHPDQVSLDAVVREAPDTMRMQAEAVLRALIASEETVADSS